MKIRRTEINLEPHMIETLRDERERTSLGPQALLKGRDDIPEGLNPAMITHWLGGRIKSVEKEHFAYALKLWFAEPGRTPPP